MQYLMDNFHRKEGVEVLGKSLWPGSVVNGWINVCACVASWRRERGRGHNGLRNV